MDDSQAPDVPGYDVGRLLGRGGNADVWLAREQRSGRDYALKCLWTGSRMRGSAAISEEEMRREIRVLSVLEHQHLIRVHAAVPFAEPASGVALAMDYAAGGSLAQLVAARGRLSVGETVTVLTPIAQVLGYLHDKGFTHSDVSPGNVLFTGHGKPMLSDLGLARMLGDPGSADTAGTRGFLDPSPVDAVRAGLQPERDVYSAAALGWFCLTGAAPGRTADRPPLSLLVPGVPRELAAALEAGLNEDRRLRPDALSLGAAVYGSAAPLPVDLSDAVPPSVMPELLTRRHTPAESKREGIRTRVQGLRRRAATFRRSAAPLKARRTALVRANAAAPVRGKHAGGPGGGWERRLVVRAALPALAVTAAAVMWWLSAAATVDPRPGAAATAPFTGSAAPSGPVVGGGGGAAVDPGDMRRQARAADPVAAVRGLAALRDFAFSSGRLELLAEVNAPGSAAAAADERIAGQLRPSGHRLEGFTSALSHVAAEEGATGASAVVRAVSATSGYTVNAEDVVLATGEPSGPQPLRLVLVSVDGTWRVSEILPGP